jgi:hypothetical protein
MTSSIGTTSKTPKREEAKSRLGSQAAGAPSDTARQFVRDIREFYATDNSIKRDEIAARQWAASSDYSTRRKCSR